MIKAIGNPVRVFAAPALKDNYIWILHDDRHAIVVDPGEASPAVAALEERELQPTAILLTHHHADHVGGVPELAQRWRLPVYGPRGESIATVTDPVVGGDLVSIESMNFTFSVLDVPGHTRGHIAYLERDRQWLFCGDTLFAAGCGRLFEGTPAQMKESLAALAALPDDTVVYCTHEYTMSNLRFAQAAEPNNAAVEDRIKREQMKRDAGQPTLPSTIGIEKSTNPFLRIDQQSIIDQLVSNKMLDQAHADKLAVFAALRKWKDNF